MRANIEKLELIEIYQDYVILKEMAEKYYYAPNTQLQGASSALLNVLRNQMTKRGFEQLEREYNDRIIEKSVEDIKKECDETSYTFKNNETEKTSIKMCSIVYTTDKGKTFLSCEPSEWKYDMGVPVGYVVNPIIEHKWDGYYATICAPKIVRNITLYGNNIDKIIDDYKYSTTLFEASNDFNGKKNTEYLWKSMSDTEDESRCALRIIGDYNVEGVDEGKIDWYIPACGEMKYINATNYGWLTAKLEVESVFSSLITSTLSDKEIGWTFNVFNCTPSLTHNMDWEENLLPFAKVKIENP